MPAASPRIVKRQECLFCFLHGMSFNYVSAVLAGRCARITWPFCCHSSQAYCCKSVTFIPARRHCRWAASSVSSAETNLENKQGLDSCPPGGLPSNLSQKSRCGLYKPYTPFFSSAVPRGVRGQEHNRLPSQPDCLRYLLSNNKGYSR